jgi:hypothetical protein
MVAGRFHPYPLQADVKILLPVLDVFVGKKIISLDFDLQGKGLVRCAVQAETGRNPGIPELIGNGWIVILG